MKEHALLRETLRNLVKLWGKDAVRLYQNEIRNGHQEPPVSDLHGSAEREVNPHNGRTSRTSGSTPPTSPISNRLTRPTTRSRADSVSHWIDGTFFFFIAPVVLFQPNRSKNKLHNRYFSWRFLSNLHVHGGC